MRTGKFFGQKLCALALMASMASIAACGQATESMEFAPAAISGKPVDNHWYPNDKLTPGHLCTVKDADFDEHRYAEQIPHCARNVSRATRIKVSAPYGVSEAQLADYQVDHLIPLALGGSNAEENLWPVPYDQARAKARFENSTYIELRDGNITQRQAIAKIRQWVRDNLRQE